MVKMGNLQLFVAFDDDDGNDGDDDGNDAAEGDGNVDDTVNGNNSCDENPNSKHEQLKLEWELKFVKNVVSPNYCGRTQIL